MLFSFSTIFYFNFVRYQKRTLPNIYAAFCQHIQYEDLSLLNTRESWKYKHELKKQHWRERPMLFRNPNNILFRFNVWNGTLLSPQTQDDVQHWNAFSNNDSHNMFPSQIPSLIWIRFPFSFYIQLKDGLTPRKIWKCFCSTQRGGGTNKIEPRQPKVPFIRKDLKSSKNILQYKEGSSDQGDVPFHLTYWIDNKES